jgi:hypothetical protein
VADNALRQPALRLVIIEIGDVDELPRLLPDCVRHLGMRVAQRAHRNAAAEVETLAGQGVQAEEQAALLAAQVESLLALPPAEAASAFVELWCALEAGLKARGVGLAQACQVQSLAMEPRLRRWRLALPPGYAGAVALLDPV